MKSGREQLRDWMDRRGLDQAETAAIFGVDYSLVSHMLSGRRLPGRDLAVKIEDLAGIQVRSWASRRRDKSVKRALGNGSKSQLDKV